MNVITKKHTKCTKFDSHHWVDTSAGGILVSECIVSASTLAWFTRYIYA